MQDFDVQYFDNAFSFLNLTVPLSWQNSLTLLSCHQDPKSYQSIESYKDSIIVQRAILR